MTADDFRAMVLALEGAVEGAHMGHPDFRANGRIFASLHSGDRFGMVKLAPEEQRACMREAPETFEPSAGAWGRQGCTNVRLATADRKAVRAAILLAYEGLMRQPPARARRTAAGPKRNAAPTAPRSRRRGRER
jgi:hypothetical protein